MVHRQDLAASMGDVNRRSEYVQCQDCGETFGGTQGDYWQLAMDAVFTCRCGSTDLALVRDKTETVIIKQ